MWASEERPAHGVAVLDGEAAAKELEPQELVTLGRRHHADVGVIETAVDDHGIGRALVEDDGDQAGQLRQRLCCRLGAFGPVLPAEEVTAAVVVLVHHHEGRREHSP